MSKTIPFEDSFANHEKSKFWSDKNIIKPEFVLNGTRNKYWFNCVCGHEILKAISAIKHGTWCSYCSIPSRSLCDNINCIFCLNKSFASSDKIKYWSNKNTETPRNIYKSSSKKYIFNCDCGHEFEIMLNDISRGRWCGYCSNPCKLLCYNENCKICLTKSFASIDKSKYWSNKNLVTPRQVLKNSDKKYLFNCNICNHEFISIIYNITNHNTWCIYCSHQQLCKNNNCEYCFKNSFASSDKAKYWSDKNILKPRDVFTSSSHNYLFNCYICNHEINIKLYVVTAGIWCYYCSNKKLCDKEDCNLCYNKSFASHEKSKFWNNKNKLNPREIFKHSSHKYYFNCNKCLNIFESNIHNISSGKWCPNCVNKTELKLYDNLIIYYPNLERQFKTEWCKKINYLPFDFVLLENKIIIELDGRQHFKQISNWVSPEINNINDKFKMKCANDNGFTVIRILQEDVLYDKYNWLEELKNNIEILIISNELQIIYMCKNNEYDNYIDTNLLI
jgi:very-short-patch-repair endonuclease